MKKANGKAQEMAKPKPRPKKLAAKLPSFDHLDADAALVELSTLARGIGPLQEAAEKALRRFVDEHGLTEDEVADRTVPKLGLDDRGSMGLDFESRAFRVGFDEHLRPFVLDESGKRLSSLPRLAKTEDAQQRWKALKLEAKAVGAMQTRRLERAMVSGRLWSVPEFRRYLLDHPLMRHLARRLVWGTFERADTPKLLAPFRVAEDGTFADVDDDTFPADRLDDHVCVGVVHPLLLSSEVRARFIATLADYGIAQPFMQLGRELCFLTEEERSSSRSSRYVGKTARGQRFFALRYRGWSVGDGEIAKPVGPRVEAVIHTDPGVEFLGSRPEDQTLEEVELRGLDSGPEVGRKRRRRKHPTFADLSPIAASELFRDLDSLLR